jgi:hypothetical protein
MLLKQLETLGMVHVPTCLVGPGLVQHSLVPDLLGPALAHHGLELGLAFLRASHDHLRIGHLGLVLGIDWRLQLGIRRGLYQRVFPHHQGFQCLGGHCHPLPCQYCCLDQNSKFILQNFIQNLKLSILRLPLIVSQTLPGAPSNQTEQTGSIKG